MENNFLFLFILQPGYQTKINQGHELTRHYPTARDRARKEQENLN